MHELYMQYLSCHADWSKSHVVLSVKSSGCIVSGTIVKTGLLDASGSIAHRDQKGDSCNPKPCEFRKTPYTRKLKLFYKATTPTRRPLTLNFELKFGCRIWWYCEQNNRFSVRRGRTSSTS